MPKTFKTTKSNYEVVKQLSRKLGLGHENHIARLALVYSIKTYFRVDNDNIVVGDSSGKEYSSSVLFGEYRDVYLLLIADKHDITVNNPKIYHLVKFHLDNGLTMLGKLILEEQEIEDLEEFIEKFCI